MAKYLSKLEIINRIKKLPQKKLFMYRHVIFFHKQGLLCDPSTLIAKFGTIYNAFKLANRNYYIRPISMEKDEILEKLKRYLPKNEPIKQKHINDLYKKGLLCHYQRIHDVIGTLSKVCKILNLKCYSKERLITKSKAIKILKYSYAKYGYLSSLELEIKSKVDSNICCPASIRKYFGTIQEAYNAINVKNIPKRKTFAPHLGREGKTEIKCREWYQKITGHKITAQYRVQTQNGNYYVDWFDHSINSPVEFDEEFHQYNKLEDDIREKQILNTLDCNPFIRINKQQWLNSAKNASLQKFT